MAKPSGSLKIKGTEIKDMKQFKKAAKSRGGGRYLKRVPQDGIIVRFVTEPTGFIQYHEAYDEDREPRYYPLTDEMYAEAMRGQKKPSKRFLCHAYDVDNKELVQLVLPTSVANDLEGFYNRHNTILDRDYDIQREGSGFDTTYKVYAEDPKKRSIDKLIAKAPGGSLPDLWAILEEQLRMALGEDDDDDDTPPKKTKRGPGKNKKSKSEPEPKKKPKSKGKKSVEDDDDEAVEKKISKSKSSKGGKPLKKKK